jgi:hypothetical protein
MLSVVEALSGGGGRAARGLLVMVACAAACREVPAPEGGVHSISTLILPAPGLVAGDTLRDSLGVAAPLDVIAYDMADQPLDPQPEHSFVVLDTGAHLDSVAARFLVGETAGTTVRVVATVGSLQTKPVSVRVTLAPDTIVPADSVEQHVSYTFPPDTVANATLNVTVRNRAADAGVEAVIVQYTIDRAPASRDGSPTAVLVTGSTISQRDTTESNGRASRVARLRLSALSGPLSVLRKDTVLVSATTAYRGVTLGTVHFMLEFEHTAPSSIRLKH